MNTLNTLLDRIETAKNLDFGDIFGKSIELFKKVWLQGLVTLLLTMLMMIPFYIIMYVPLIAMGVLDPESFQQGNQPNMAIFIPFYALMFVFMLVALIIGLALKAAFYRICKTKDLNEATADDYFYFFKKPYLGKTIKLGAAMFAISVVGMVLCFLPLIYAMVPIALMNVIFALNPDMSVSEIVKAGFKLGNKKWFITFGLMIVAGFLAQIIGMLMCFIGIFVTASFAGIPVYYVYKESVGINEQTPIDEIGKISE